MTENKRFTQKDEDDWEILDRNKHFAYAHSGYQAEKIIDELNELVDTNRELYKENKQLKKENEWLKSIHFANDVLKENEQLKLYKQAVSDVLKSWSQKNITAKQLQVVIAIMEELNIMGDV